MSDYEDSCLRSREQESTTNSEDICSPLPCKANPAAVQGAQSDLGLMTSSNITIAKRRSDNQSPTATYKHL